jgi:hypothetical protein
MRSVFVFVVFIALAAWPAAGQVKSELNPRPFPVGETIERHLNGNEVHVYALELKPGDSLLLNLIEKGINCAVAISFVADGDVKRMLQVDFGEGFGRETITYVSKA